MKNLIILALICLSTNVHSRSTIVRGQIIDSISGDFDSMLKTKVLGKESTVIFYYEDRTNDIYALYTKD